MKNCKFCDEKISKKAYICNHCDRDNRPVFEALKYIATVSSALTIASALIIYIASQINETLNYYSNNSLSVISFQNEGSLILRNNGKKAVFIDNIRVKLDEKFNASFSSSIFEKIDAGQTLKFDTRSKQVLSFNESGEDLVWASNLNLADLLASKKPYPKHTFPIFKLKDTDFEQSLLIAKKNNVTPNFIETTCEIQLTDLVQISKQLHEFTCVGYLAITKSGFGEMIKEMKNEK